MNFIHYTIDSSFNPVIHSLLSQITAQLAVDMILILLIFLLMINLQLSIYVASLTPRLFRMAAFSMLHEKKRFSRMTPKSWEDPDYGTNMTVCLTIIILFSLYFTNRLAECHTCYWIVQYRPGVL